MTTKRRGLLGGPLVATAIVAMITGSFALDGNTANAADSCGYPIGTTGRLGTVFNESEVLRTFRIDTTKGTIQAFYNDEHALTLGENDANGSITPFVATYPKPGTTTKLAGDANNPSIGDPNAVDPKSRPIYPALFLTDTTSNPSSTSGDWQQQLDNSTAIKPDFVAGTWKSFTPGATISDPAKNNWWLGPNADAVPLIAGALPKDEGYGAEVRWNIDTLPGLIKGHSYRAQFMVHDGDQNKTGGDVGEACVNFTLPLATMSTRVSSAGPLTPGTAVHDTATIVGNLSTKTPSGTVAFFLCGPIATGACDGTTNIGTSIGTGTLSGSGGTASANSPDVNTGAGLTPGRYCFRAEWPGDATYTTALKEYGGADGTNECFTVARIPSSTVTTPVDGSGTATSAIQLGDTIYDEAIVSGTAVGGTPTGTVSFFICGPIASGTCTSGGTAVTGNPVPLTAGPPYTASATSGAVTPASVGTYCFRGEYSGDDHYLPSSDSSATECFTVSTTSATTSAQTWLPNDSATVSSATPLNGSLSFTLHSGGDCTGAALRAAESFTFTNASSPQSRATTNSTVSVTTSSTVSWEVVFTSSDPRVASSMRCESTVGVITN